MFFSFLRLSLSRLFSSRLLPLSMFQNPKETYMLKAPKETFDEIAEIVHRGTYASRVKPASPKPRQEAAPAKPVAVKKAEPIKADTPAEPKKEEKEDELFIVRDGYLMLMEHANDPEPLLKLFHSDCITTPDDANKEFVIRHMPGTPDEESYVFGFLTDEIYQG
ncbi:hypothetical protein TGP89_202120B [Toxoplasma gondii p89]|uniref:Uncharacterized protein n=1 Tax=Toxoplasma gondii p89 TaxID=943119 RepID=A0A086KMB3_TOXGO|nr:hypothetical protein TGP89_202120B [Toxoplasma gondii p89]